MLDEYVLVPDIFDSAAYSHPAYIEMCLRHLKEPIYHEALVRDLCGGEWSRFCSNNTGNVHRLCKEILKKLRRDNRLREFPTVSALPASSAEWCLEGLESNKAAPLTGIIAAHATKLNFGGEGVVASIENVTSTPWWHARSPSITVDRKTVAYRRVLDRVSLQANSLMFVDPNLDPSGHNYREFHQLLTPALARVAKPRIEIHRSICKGDGPARTFPTGADWRGAFGTLDGWLAANGLSAEVFFWDDFHERYLIADVVGISVPAGFDVTSKADDWSTWGRLGRADKDTIQRMFDPASRGGSLKFRFRIGATP